MFKMVNYICRNVSNQSSKSRAFAAKELILIGFIEAGDDISLAFEKLKEIYPKLKRGDIQMVSRFRVPDETGNKPLKVVLWKESIVSNIVENIESPDENGEFATHIRRGLTWEQRSANASVRRLVEEKNSDIPEGHPDRWEVKQVGGHQFAVQPAASKKKFFSRHQQNTAQRTGNQGPRVPPQPKPHNQPQPRDTPRRTSNEPRPGTSGHVQKKKNTNTITTKTSVTLAEAVGALNAVNSAVASTNPASKTSRTSANQPSGTSNTKEINHKAKNSRTAKASKQKQPLKTIRKAQPQPQPQPDHQQSSQPSQGSQSEPEPDTSLMTNEQKLKMFKKLEKDLKKCPNTRAKSLRNS